MPYKNSTSVFIFSFQNELYAMWVLNRKLEKQIEAISLAIKTKKTEIAIDQLLNVQVRMPILFYPLTLFYILVFI